ncbi:MAG: hypothetical protein IPH94_08450 [Saprospiraceae bacterium]|nr:hypothetical protein [Saprospiraceae bacterium]
MVNIDNMVNIDTMFPMCLQRQSKPITSKNPKFPKISNFPLCSTNNSFEKLLRADITKIIAATTKVPLLPDCLSSIEFFLFKLFFLLITYNGFGLGEGGNFQHKPACRRAGVHAENKTFGYH